jgi:hypothetical protein
VFEAGVARFRLQSLFAREHLGGVFLLSGVEDYLEFVS